MKTCRRKIVVKVILGFVVMFFFSVLLEKPECAYASKTHTISNYDTVMVLGETYNLTDATWEEKGKTGKIVFSEDYKTSKSQLASSNPDVIEAGWEYLKAVGIGKSTITVTSEDGTESASCVIEVKSGSDFELSDFPETMTIYKGESHEFGMMTLTCQSYSYTMYAGYSNVSKGYMYQITSSNPDIVYVDDTSSSIKYSAKGIALGTCTLTLTPVNASIDCGVRTCTVTVADKSKVKASKPTIIKQTDYVNVLGEHATVYENQIDVFFYADSRIYYEILRSSSKNGTYKKVAEVSPDISDNAVFYNAGVLRYSDQTVKANKKYYYKIRARYDYATSWSKPSASAVYFTAAKTIPSSKISYTKTTRKAKWTTRKNVSGYIYQAKLWKFKGYNVFGQELYTEATEIFSTTKTSVTVKKINSSAATEIIFVKPYTKHNGYYYVDGYAISKDLSDYKKSTGQTVVWND